MPDTSASLYEQLFALTTVMKQRVVDNFSGDSLNERWTTEDHSGTNTFAMVDAVDEGFNIVTAGADGNAGSIHFNNKRQYAHNGSVIIGVISSDSTSTNQTQVGLTNNVGNPTVTNVVLARLSSAANFNVGTADASTFSSSNSSIAKDTNFHTHKLVLGASDVEYIIDGISEVTKTTNLPTAKCEPFFFQRADSAAAYTGNIRYLEAYNT